MQIQVQLNGKHCHIAAGITVAELLESQRVDVSCVAVALEQTFVPRRAYATTEIFEGQAIEIVAPMQGG